MQSLNQNNVKLSNGFAEDDDYDTVDEPAVQPKTNGQSRNENKAILETDKDGFTIPKPPIREASSESTPETDVKESVGESDKSDSTDQSESKKRLSTPLAAMLPSKYADFDVTELFPEFRHNQVLRFSRLFGPGKSSSLPQIWKNVKNRRKSRQIFENKLFIVQASQKGATENEWDFGACPAEEVPAEMIEEDDEIKLQQNNFVDSAHSRKISNENEENTNIADWRYGPAQIWYDMLKVPENGEGFDYGFKLKAKEDGNEEDEEQTEKPSSYSSYDKTLNDPDDAFHMVTQLQWENEVIWNADESRQKILAKLTDKHLASGWLPSGHNRTATAFNNNLKTTSTAKPSLPPSSLKKSDKKMSDSMQLDLQHDEKTWYSIFPIENEELIYGLWEDDVIWDAEMMDRIPPPRVLTLDRNDENIILEVPNDEEQKTEVKVSVPTKEKKEGIRKSRLLLGKAGVIAEPETSPPSPQSSRNKDPFNISNDEYYSQKTTTDASLKSHTGNLIQHSIPALELRQPFFPTFLSYQRLRGFHRPALKRYSHGTIADTLPHGVNPLVKHIKRKAKTREQERIASGGGEMFFMRTPEDLTGKDGDLILAEYSEEHPPLMSQVGMASKIKNYYKRVSNRRTLQSFTF